MYHIHTMDCLAIKINEVMLQIKTRRNLENVMLNGRSHSIRTIQNRQMYRDGEEVVSGCLQSRVGGGWGWGNGSDCHWVQGFFWNYEHVLKLITITVAQLYKYIFKNLLHRALSINKLYDM